MRRRRLAPILWMAGVALWPGARATAAEFQFSRSVRPAAVGANRLPVDVPLLSGAAAGLGDLRLFTAAGVEVPYLLIEPPNPKPAWARGVLRPTANTKDASGFEVDLGNALLVDRLRLEGLPPPYLKRARLEGSGDRARWVLLVEEGTVFHLPEERLAQEEFGFPASEFCYLRVTWDDRSSGRQPLPQGATARRAGSVAGPAALRAEVPVAVRGSEPGRSRFRIRLPAAGLPIRALEVVAPGGNLLREAVASEARLSGSELVQVELGRAMLRRAFRGEVAASQMTVPLARSREAELELRVEDGDNPPLRIERVIAIFEPQPWIYFESPDSGPLVARFGAPGLAAPRYDLEATRREAAVTRVAEAQWGDRAPETPVAAAASFPAELAAGAALRTESFRHSRAVPSGPLGLTALRLDAHVLAHCRDFGEVRLADSSGRQVPYLVERLGEPLEVPLPSLETTPAPARRRGEADGAGRSYYRLALPYTELPASTLVVETDARVFERRVSLSVRDAAPGFANGGAARSIATAHWRHADPDTPAPALSLDVPRLQGREAVLEIDDGDNRPLVLREPVLLLPAVRLRFVRTEPASELRLLYGQANPSAARYDLALLAPRLLGAAAHELELAPLTAAATVDTGGPQALFWLVVIAAAAVLLVLALRLALRQNDDAA